MNKRVLIAIAAAAMTFVSCNKAAGIFPVGIPTVDLQINTNTIVYDQGTLQYVWTLELGVYSRPGSPAGRLISLKLDNGGDFTAMKVVNVCALTEKNPCPNGSITYKLSAPSYFAIPSYQVVGLVLAGENDIDATVYTTPFTIGRPQ